MERGLKQYLVDHSDDADAHFLLARTVNRRGKTRDAETLLARCLDLAPDYIAARFQRARLLMRRHEFGQALLETDKLLAGDKGNPLFRQLKADVLRTVGGDDEARAIYEQLAEENRTQAECWISYGDSLRAAGLRDECIAAYRRSLACRPTFGLAWWSLANLKTYRFDGSDIESMKGVLNRHDIAAEDRINVMFSLGKAYEDLCVFAESFAWYSKANAARRLAIEHDWDTIAQRLAADRSMFTREFLENRSGAGAQAPDPIFILGRPRSGSTLIEQILSTHSAIEGTAELPYIADFAIRLEEEHGTDLPGVLLRLDPSTLTALGQEYLERVQIHRKTARPFFIDKAPANYHQIGLILLMLPNAKIIDARRHPAACSFSMFKHNYIETNLRLAELGRVYCDYVALMAHFDRVAPGRVHRVIYENVVANPEAEVRKLLDYLGLPFEERCLNFHETKRTVRTPSSEQVRRPISGEAVDHWRKFEPWLSPLVESLGPVLKEYPAVPETLR